MAARSIPRAKAVKMGATRCINLRISASRSTDVPSQFSLRMQELVQNFVIVWLFLQAGAGTWKECDCTPGYQLAYFCDYHRATLAVREPDIFHHRKIEIA